MRALKTLSGRFLLAMLCLLVLCLTNTQAEIKVYNANEQYLGMLFSETDTAGNYSQQRYLTVYIPYGRIVEYR